MNTVSQVLWMTLDKSQYYLIPDEVVLAPGELQLATLFGREQHVSPREAATWAVSREEAEAHLREQMQGYLQGTGNVVGGILSGIQVSAERDGDDEISVIDLAATLMGISKENVQEGEFGQLGLPKILEGLADFVADIIAEDSQRLEAARKDARAFRSRLAEQGIHVSETVEKLPDTIHTWYRVFPHKDAFHRFEQLLRDTAGQMRHASPETMPEMRHVIDGFTSGLTDILEGTDTPTESPEEERARYREVARKSINATQGEAPTFDFKRLWDERHRDKDVH